MRDNIDAPKLCDALATQTSALTLVTNVSAVHLDTLAKRGEVFRSLGNDVTIQTHHDSANMGIVDRDIEENTTSNVSRKLRHCLCGFDEGYNMNLNG